MDIQSGPKWRLHFVYTPELRQIYNDFQNSFAVRIKKKFLITLPLKKFHHASCVSLHCLVKFWLSFFQQSSLVVNFEGFSAFLIFGDSVITNCLLILTVKNVKVG